MANSTIPFHPLDIRENRRYTITQGATPVINWQYTVQNPGDSGIHDWSGYWRVETSGTYQIYVRADDNGYIRINGCESGFTGHNSSKTSTPVSVFLKKGYHFVELHHENLTPLRDVQNAQEFAAYVGETQITELKNIDAPTNLLSLTDAYSLLGNYAVANYHTIPADRNEAVWKLFGEEYVKNASAAGWNNTCATRLSIALNRSGYRLNGADGANNVQIGGGDISILNPDGEMGSAAGKHIIVSARKMETYLRGVFGEPDYSSEEEYSTPQEGDVVIYAGTSHSGMCPGLDPTVGYFISGSVWLLSRSTLSD